MFILDIKEIDLTTLIGGLPLTVLYTLVKNRIGVDFDILIDTRVNGFMFIDTHLTDRLCKGLDLTLTLLYYTITIKGYDGRKGPAVTYYLTINLIVNRRC